MARAICGVCHRGGAGDAANPDPNRDTIGAMLAELPGLGHAGRINGGVVSFGYRALRADAGEKGQEDAWQARCSARGLIAVADARLDNRAELASALGLGAAESIGATDCGLILRAYERWSENCPLQLHGDYAFAVWDPAKHLLFCARRGPRVEPGLPAGISRPLPPRRARPAARHRAGRRASERRAGLVKRGCAGIHRQTIPSPMTRLPNTA